MVSLGTVSKKQHGMRGTARVIMWVLLLFSVEEHRQAGAVYRQAKVEENHEPFSGFTKASTRYKPPPKITNAKQISIHQPCSDDSNDSGRSRKSRQRTLTNDKRN